jgi:hypothetical protein
VVLEASEDVEADEVGEAPVAPAPEGGDDFGTSWAAVRDANIRPYADWRRVPPVALPVMAVKAQHHGQHGPGQGQRQKHRHQQQQQRQQQGFNNDGGGGRMRRRRGRNRRNHEHRDRGPRLPGFYNPGGD